MFTAALFIVVKGTETTQMAIDWWMHKQNVGHSYNGILFGSKKKWCIYTCYNMDEPWNHYLKWKMPVTNKHMLCDSIFCKMSKIGKHTETESRSVFAGTGGRRGWELHTGILRGWSKCHEIK